MKRIVIVGCSGSGKSTLARVLGERLSLPVAHLDNLFWLPGWIEGDRSDFDEKLCEAVQQDGWVIEGNYRCTLPLRMERADTMIFLDFPRWLCVWRVFKRTVTNYGRTRQDMAAGCPERFDWVFAKYVWNFHRTHRPELDAAAKSFSGKLLHLRSPGDVAELTLSLGNVPETR